MRLVPGAVGNASSSGLPGPLGHARSGSARTTHASLPRRQVRKLSRADQPHDGRLRHRVLAQSAQRVDAPGAARARCELRAGQRSSSIVLRRRCASCTHRERGRGAGAGRRTMRRIGGGQQVDVGIAARRARRTRWRDGRCAPGRMCRRRTRAGRDAAVSRSRREQRTRAWIGDGQQQAFERDPASSSRRPALGDAVDAPGLGARTVPSAAPMALQCARYAACFESQIRCALNSAARLPPRAWTRARAAAAAIPSRPCRAAPAPPRLRRAGPRSMRDTCAAGRSSPHRPGGTRRSARHRRPAHPCARHRATPPSASNASLSISCAAASRLPSTRSASRCTASRSARRPLLRRRRSIQSGKLVRLDRPAR